VSQLVVGHYFLPWTDDKLRVLAKWTTEVAASKENGSCNVSREVKERGRNDAGYHTWTAFA
jgi:hypothetical protein